MSSLIACGATPKAIFGCAEISKSKNGDFRVFVGFLIMSAKILEPNYKALQIRGSKSLVSCYLLLKSFQTKSGENF